MVEDTPRLQERRKKLAEEFDKYWENDFERKQIVRKPRDWKQRLWEYLVQKKFSIFAFYWWVKFDRLKNQEARKFHIPIRSDNTPAKGVPMKYELQGGWTFKEDELKYLKDGPLLSENHLETLVGHDQGLKKVQRLSREWGPLIGIVLGILTFAFRWLEIF